MRLPAEVLDRLEGLGDLLGTEAHDKRRPCLFTPDGLRVRDEAGQGPSEAPPIGEEGLAKDIGIGQSTGRGSYCYGTCW